MRRINGLITPPGDKSITQRIIMIGAMASGETKIENFPKNDNCILTAKAMMQYANGEFDKPFYCGGSAFLARALCGILVGLGVDTDVTGDRYLSNRPMKRVVEPIEKMDAGIITEDWHLPFKVLGGIKLHGIDYEMEVQSAQVKTAILFAALFAEGPTTIYEKIKTRNHTEILLKKFGADITCEPWGEKGTKITLNPGLALNGITMRIPGDFSSAMYFAALAMLLPESEIYIKDVSLNSTRTRFLDIISRMGGSFEIISKTDDDEASGDIVFRTSELTGTIIEGDEIVEAIDEIPILAVLAAFANGETIIKDASELRNKECDRLHALYENLSRMGAKITETKDGLIIKGGGEFTDCEVETYNDHRIAMSMAVARVVAGFDPYQKGMECVRTSYPEFFDEIKRLVKARD